MPLYEVVTAETVYERYFVTADTEDTAKRIIGDPKQRRDYTSSPVASRGGDIEVIEVRERGGN